MLRSRTSLEAPPIESTAVLLDSSSERSGYSKSEAAAPQVGFGHGDDDDRHRLRGCKEELKRILAIALPSSFVDTISFVASLFPVAQIGRLGTAQLSALTLGSTLFNITGLSIMVGLTSGLDTVCGQMYGAGLYSAVGIVFQRGTLVCLLMGVPSYALWWRAEAVLRLMGQAPDTSRLAAQYVQHVAPALALSTVKLACRSYFSAQGVVLPVSLITFICTMLAPLLNFLFITVLCLGLPGAALAYVVEEAVAVVLLLALLAGQTLWQPKERRTWGGFDRHALQGWVPYLQVALPATAMTVIDWWCLELMVLLAGMGKDADIKVSAMGLCFNAFTFVYYAVDGFGVAASSRIANNLGALRSRRARTACLLCLALGLAACVAWCGLMVATSRWWMGLFTRSSEVEGAVSASLPFVALAVVGYSTNTVLSGVLRGAGRQTIGMWVNLICLWAVGVPTAAALSLGAGRGNVGLWGGIALMNLLQGAGLTWKVLRFNWAREVARSQSRVSLHTPLLGEQGGGATEEDAGYGSDYQDGLSDYEQGEPEPGDDGADGQDEQAAADHTQIEVREGGEGRYLLPPVDLDPRRQGVASGGAAAGGGYCNDGAVAALWPPPSPPPVVVAAAAAADGDTRIINIVSSSGSRECNRRAAGGEGASAAGGGTEERGEEEVFVGSYVSLADGVGGGGGGLGMRYRPPPPSPPPAPAASGTSQERGGVGGAPAHATGAAASDADCDGDGGGSVPSVMRPAVADAEPPGDAGVSGHGAGATRAAPAALAPGWSSPPLVDDVNVGPGGQPPIG